MVKLSIVSSLDTLPIVMGSVFGVWSLGFIIWIVHCLIYKSQRIPLQRILAVVPAAKIIHAAIGFFFFYQCSIFGTVDGNDAVECDTLLYVAYQTSYIIFQVALFASLLALAKGWCITRTEIDPMEKRSIIWNLFCLSLCMGARYFINEYFVFPLIVVFIVVIGHLFSSITFNLRALHAHVLTAHQLQLQRNQQQNTLSSLPAYKKFMAFRKFQYIVSFFISAEILYFLVVDMFISEYTISVALQESIELMFVFAVGILFRLRRFSNVENQQQQQQQQQQQRRQHESAEEHDRVRLATEESNLSGDPSLFTSVIRSIKRRFGFSTSSEDSTSDAYDEEAGTSHQPPSNQHPEFLVIQNPPTAAITPNRTVSTLYLAILPDSKLLEHKEEAADSNANNSIVLEQQQQQHHRIFFRDDEDYF